MIRASLAGVLMMSVALPAVAQTAGSANPPSRIRNVMLAPGEKCPQPTSADEVVVCANLEERYRIPKELRNVAPIPPQNQSWAARQSTLDEVAREAGGLPNTCSPVGLGGQTGCNQIMMQRAREDVRNGTNVPPPR